MILIYTIKITKESPNYINFKSVTKWILIHLFFIVLYLLISFIYIISNIINNEIFFIILYSLQKIILLLLSYILTIDFVIIKLFK